MYFLISCVLFLIIFGCIMVLLHVREARQNEEWELYLKKCKMEITSPAGVTHVELNGIYKRLLSTIDKHTKAQRYRARIDAL